MFEKLRNRIIPAPGNLQRGRDDVPQLLTNADVFWLTSKWEGLPNVVLEAMACGKPVIARDVGACRELINNNENGFLVSGRDAKNSLITHSVYLPIPRTQEEWGWPVED
jgi:glycosyltransferase involved in cell wall biosynthesis